MDPKENRRIKVLFAGEAITTQTIIYKGWDSIHLANYSEHGGYFLDALRDSGEFEVHYVPTHKVAEEFPWSIEDLSKYDVIAVSDVGSKTFLISRKTMNGMKTPNRLKLVKEYVENGGGFIMWGGYLSFTGYHGYAHYRGTPIEEVLPVTCLDTDDTVEVPEGFVPKVLMKDHPIFEGIPEQWEGWFLSYNRLIPKTDSTVLANISEDTDDPFLVVRSYRNGRTVASAVDCAHHGAAPSFLQWKYSANYFRNIVKWCAKSL
jgi:uncharacterized membrane protein